MPTARQRSHTQARFERVSDLPWSGGGLVIIENGLLDNAVDKWQLHPGATDLRLISHNFFNPISPLLQQLQSTPRGQHFDDIQRQTPDDWMRIQVPSWDVNLCREKDNNGGNQFRVTEHYVPRWTRTMLGEHCWFRPQNFVFEYQDLMRYCDLPKFNSHLHLIILSKVSFSELFQHYFIYLIIW